MQENCLELKGRPSAIFPGDGQSDLLDLTQIQSSCEIDRNWKYPNFYNFFKNKIGFFGGKLWKNGNCDAISCPGRSLKGEITSPTHCHLPRQCSVTIPLWKSKKINWKNCNKKKPPRTMLVKIRISPNEIAILQNIALEVDSVWVVPVSPDQKFGFRIEKWAFLVASKWPLDHFCIVFFLLENQLRQLLLP